MERLAPGGPVYQAGTLSGNPMATLAGLTTLRLCTPDVYARLDATAATVGRAVSEALAAEGVAHRVQTAGNLFSVFFDEEEVRTYDDASAQETFRYPAFFHATLERGVYLLERGRVERRGQGAFRHIPGRQRKSAPPLLSALPEERFVQ